MSITKDYEGNEIIEDKELATKPSGQDRTLDALMEFTQKSIVYTRELELVLIEKPEIDLRETLAKQTHYMCSKLEEHVQGRIDHAIIDLYMQRIQQSDDEDTQGLAHLVLSPLIQKAYNDGTHFVFLDAVKYPFLESSALFGLEGTAQNLLKITINCNNEVMICKHAEITLQGRTSEVYYFDDKNAYAGEHSNMDVLKAAGPHNTKNTCYVVDEHGTITGTEEF